MMENLNEKSPKYLDKKDIEYLDIEGNVQNGPKFHFCDFLGLAIFSIGW